MFQHVLRTRSIAKKLNFAPPFHAFEFAYNPKEILLNSKYLSKVLSPIFPYAPCLSTHRVPSFRVAVPLDRHIPAILCCAGFDARRPEVDIAALTRRLLARAAALAGREGSRQAAPQLAPAQLCCRSACRRSWRSINGCTASVSGCRTPVYGCSDAIYPRTRFSPAMLRTMPLTSRGRHRHRRRRLDPRRPQDPARRLRERSRVPQRHDNFAVPAVDVLVP